MIFHSNARYWIKKETSEIHRTPLSEGGMFSEILLHIDPGIPALRPDTRMR